METNKHKKEHVLNKLRREEANLNSGSPQEGLSSSMTTTKKTFKILWRPNNYRRQTQVKTKDNSTINKIKRAIDAMPGSNYNYCNHTKMISVHNFYGITIQYGKHNLTGIYQQNIIAGKKEVYLIETNEVKQLDIRLKQKKEEIQKKIDYALFEFSKKFKIKIPYCKPYWAKHGYEDWFRGEEFIDKIPREVIIHDTHFKKVYGKGIEFISDEVGQEPTVKLVNYLQTRAIEKVAPEIANELNKNREILEDIRNIKESGVKTEDLLLILKEQAEINKHTSELLNTYIRSQLPKKEDLQPKEPETKPDYVG